MINQQRSCLEESETDTQCSWVVNYFCTCYKSTCMQTKDETKIKSKIMLLHVKYALKNFTHKPEAMTHEEIESFIFISEIRIILHYFHLCILIFSCNLHFPIQNIQLMLGCIMHTTCMCVLSWWDFVIFRTYDFYDYFPIYHFIMVIMKWAESPKFDNNWFAFHFNWFEIAILNYIYEKLLTQNPTIEDQSKHELSDSIASIFRYVHVFSHGTV